MALRGTGRNAQGYLGGYLTGGGGKVEQEGQPIWSKIGAAGVDGRMEIYVGTETGDAHVGR